MSHKPPFEPNYQAHLIRATPLLGTEVSCIVCISFEIWGDCASHVDPFSAPPCSFSIILFQLLLDMFTSSASCADVPRRPS